MASNAKNPENLTSDGSPMGQNASLGRRLAAICADWVLCLGVSSITTPRVPGGREFMPLLVFFLEVLFFTTFIQASAGQRILNIRVVDSRTNGVATFTQILLRTFLICLVVPPLLTYSGVGLHDRATHTKTVYVPGL
jgi:uncharacterized RDD family membrane protein YckC